ncbi:MAG: PLP-dependent aminotransferase family protein, partial [Betaproteobacteria bacterium]
AHLRRMRTLYAARRDALVQAFDRVAPAYALGGLAAGMHATMALSADTDDARVAASAARAGVRVLPLSRYASRPGICNGLLIGYSALTERRIAQGAARLARVLVALRTTP